MKYNLYEENKFTPTILKITIESMDELLSLHDIFIKSEGKFSEKFHEIASGLEDKEKKEYSKPGGGL